MEEFPSEGVKIPGFQSPEEKTQVREKGHTLRSFGLFIGVFWAPPGGEFSNGDLSECLFLQAAIIRISMHAASCWKIKPNPPPNACLAYDLIIE